MRARFLLLLFAIACEDDEWCAVAEGSSVTVCVVDQHGQPFTPEQVWWYWPPEGGSYDGEHEAECINPACSLWTVPDTVTGDLFVSAFWRGPAHHDPACRYESYADQAVSVDPAELGVGGVAVELALDSTAVACD